MLFYIQSNNILKEKKKGQTIKGHSEWVITLDNGLNPLERGYFFVFIVRKGGDTTLHEPDDKSTSFIGEYPV